MTTSISYIAPPLGLTECNFVASAKSAYDVADSVVNLLNSQRRIGVLNRKENINILRDKMQEIENNLWEALARDYPKFRFRRQNQTIVISYYGNNNNGERYSNGQNAGQSITINSGEVNKIKSWGVNDYYEALDTVNRLQNAMYNSGMTFPRRWMDDWNRLGKQLVIIDRRNCKGFAEPSPGPIGINPPPTLPKPPNPPGPGIPTWPLPPIVAQGNWSTYETRNWSLIGWTNSDIVPMSGYQTTRPSIATVGGRSLIYYAPRGINTNKLVWLFHETGGSARSWFTDYEKLKYVKKLTDAGYAVAAFESYNRISRKWAVTSNPRSNREIIDLLACQDFLAQVGILKRICTAVTSVNPQTGETTISQTCAWTTPQYGVGMSSGASLLSYAAKALSITKIALHNASGVSQIIRNADYAADTLWMMSANDIAVSTAEAVANYNYLLTNRPTLDASLFTQVGSKVTSAIFDDIPNVGTSISSDIIAGLITGGFINSDGTLTTKYSSAGRAQREIYLQNTLPGIILTAFGNDLTNYRTYITDIIAQLKICFSDHEFSGWQRLEDGTLTERDLAFFAQP